MRFAPRIQNVQSALIMVPGSRSSAACELTRRLEPFGTHLAEASSSVTFILSQFA
jgi:hypothetical protein